MIVQRGIRSLYDGASTATHQLCKPGKGWDRLSTPQRTLEGLYSTDLWGINERSHGYLISHSKVDTECTILLIKMKHGIEGGLR